VIWQACDGNNQITRIAGTLYRLVESQEQIATMGYVDTLEEQALLEEMLEETKPDYPDGIEVYHYLLTTPFRYPPLEYGSRFGHTNEPSLFYAGCDPSVTLAESAFYRFVFLDSMEDVTEEDKIRSEHTMFSADYQTDNGVRLQQPPFNQYQVELTHLTDYSHSQQLGSDMREAGVMGFEYESARDVNHGTCVALYNTSPFSNSKPTNTEQWLCETSMTEVLFKAIEQNVIFQFSIDDFVVNDVLPLPA
jgi:hypothetical protein